MNFSTNFLPMERHILSPYSKNFSYIFVLLFLILHAHHHKLLFSLHFHSPFNKYNKIINCFFHFYNNYLRKRHFSTKIDKKIAQFLGLFLCSVNATINSRSHFVSFARYTILTIINFSVYNPPFIKSPL